MTNSLSLIGRTNSLFDADLLCHEQQLCEIVARSRFLVVGGAGSIGQAVVKELFKRNPDCLDVVDISENNLVELVRDLRSSLGYTSGDFNTYALDIDSVEFESLLASKAPYDYVLNLSALKHVRSEKDAFTLMRLLKVNVFNTVKLFQLVDTERLKKYFCVSTDKAANPVNLMGASKSIMEQFLMQLSETRAISTARFANVAFSDGSLLHGFKQRIEKQQPIVAPNDVRRYFVTAEESGLLCLFSCIFGDNRDIYFPKLDDQLHLQKFSAIAERYLESLNFTPYLCDSEEQARALATELPSKGLWPCLFTGSDTTGEKPFEEFFTAEENLDMISYQGLGVIKQSAEYNPQALADFSASIASLIAARSWNKNQLIQAMHKLLPNLDYQDLGKYLDGKM